MQLSYSNNAIFYLNQDKYKIFNTVVHKAISTDLALRIEFNCGRGRIYQKDFFVTGKKM